MRSARTPRSVAGVVLLAVLLSGLVSAGDGAARAAPGALPPTSERLILDALRRGRIDYPTSVLFRAAARFGDSRLPAPYAGTPADGDARALVEELRRLRPSLSATRRAEAERYLLRPTDPRSVHHRPATEAAATAAGGAGVQAEGVECVDGWAARASTLHPGAFKAWASCTGDYVADIERLVALVDSFWAPMTDLMGPPVADLGGEAAGGDPAIDFYLVGPGEATPGRQAEGNEFALAYAQPDAPFAGVTSSAFVVIWRDQVENPEFRATLVHEFFHVLQDAHNMRLSFNYTTRPYDEEWDVLLLAQNWWSEATAEWAAAHFERGQPDSRYGLELIHSRFVRRFQRTDESLHAPYGQMEDLSYYKYAAYIWFLFMEQERGPQAIAQIFRDLEGVAPGDVEGAMDVIDAQLPFATYFRDFAVRNLNLNLLPGDPIAPSYDDLDPVFPDNYPPPMTVGEMRSESLLFPQAAGEEPRRVIDRIKPLSAHYYRFMPDPDSEIAQVGFDFSAFGPAAAVDVDALVKIRGQGWERRRLDPASPTLFCRDQPADDLQTIIFVVSNHDRNLANAVIGELAITVRSEPCGGGGG